jgi:hypothetical protein
LVLDVITEVLDASNELGGGEAYCGCLDSSVQDAMRETDDKCR